MKLLLLIPELGYGGAETALLRLANQLAEHHAITLAVFRRTYQSSGYTNQSINFGCPVVELDRQGLPAPSWMLPLPGRWWRRARELWRLKRQHSLCISFLSGANLLNAMVSAGRPCVLSERGSKRHDSSQSCWRRWLWCRLLDPFAYGRADRIVTVSEGLRKEVRQALPVSRREIVQTIMGYLDVNEALAAGSASIESELVALSNRPLLVAAGRLHHQKGFQLLIPLFAQAAQSVPGSALLLIGDGPLRSQLIDQSNLLGLRVDCPGPHQFPDPKAQLIFLGYRPQPARYTRLGRAFVLPSLYEGLPNMLLEAVAAGSWCLASDCPWGPAEILTDPALGQILPPIDNPAHHAIWIEAMIAALQRPAGSRLAMPMRRSVAERFSVEASAQRWQALLESVAQQNWPIVHQGDSVETK